MWSIELRHFQWPWTTLTPSFKVTPFFDGEYLRNGTTYRHRFNEILIGTYTRPTQQCHFEWSWVTLSHLAKYSMTRCARGLSAAAELIVKLSYGHTHSHTHTHRRCTSAKCVIYACFHDNCMTIQSNLKNKRNCRQSAEDNTRLLHRGC